MATILPFSEACERNKEPILEILREVFAGREDVLEIGSGTGQHAAYFAAAMAHLRWHPTERREHLDNLRRRLEQQSLPTLSSAVELDVTQSAWPVSTVDAVFSANTLHIMSWPSVVSMFEGIASVLAPAGVVCLYGPFNYAGHFTAASNAQFDRWLRSRDAGSGIRDLEAVRSLAERCGLRLSHDHGMPANNRLVVFES